MKQYTKPNMKISKFDIQDIITASAVNGTIVNSSQLTGTDAAMYDVYVQGSGVDNANVSIFTW